MDCPQVGRQAGDAIDVTVPETSGPGQPLRVPQGFSTSFPTLRLAAQLSMRDERRIGEM